ncbi:xenotropic and polytropic retrovirus receptor 1 homolog, partial [Sinocyclocheilus grahami]|uniref:xenotropic and polytropic retrovirus receptor 1 homolog n=1 Tax=Sinocyclocheilus grahami TaxID=75366 RepID=UPI0007ACC789
FRVVTAPFHRVGFADFWLADQLNSLVVVLMDLEYMICFYSMELNWSKSEGELWIKEGGGICHSYSYGVRAVIQCLPAWFRFVQCLRRYRDTKRAFPHLANAGKYSTTFFAVIFSALYKTHETLPEGQVFFYLLIAFKIINSCYTLMWDLKMDWGLFDHNAGENTLLREEIVYPQRFVWNFFRLENEHLNNCGEFRAVRDISVAPMNADDQTLLEQMMDQEDGVRNRQGKKNWKRTYSMPLRRPYLSS